MNPIVYYIKQALRDYYPDSEVTAMTKLLLTQVFGMSVTELYAGKDSSFSADEKQQLDNILFRMQKYEPLQYIIGIETFCGLEFEVNRHVLIPRPETAELVNWIEQENPDFRGRILDIGTGSGCIAISLAKHFPGAEVTAWDISAEALEVAGRNCQRNATEVRLVHQDVLQATPSGDKFHLIVSNPPYITEKEKVDMEANVLEWEPETALFIPNSHPLLFYREIAELGKDMLHPKGKLYFEINREYGNETIAMLKELNYRHIELRKDMAQNDRMIRAER